jgi:carnitine O-acetyltransferase
MGVFDNDSALPSLPIPPLDETCALLKQTTKPFLEPLAWERTCAAIDRFAAQAGPLQSLLVRHRDARPHNASWLRPIWDDIYLTYRGPLPIHMNYGLAFVRDRWSGGLSSFIAAMCCIVDEIRNETLLPEATKAGFLSMDTLRTLIYTRLPCPIRDVWQHPPLAAPMAVAVACKGHWFIMTVHNDKGELLAPAAIENALAVVRKRAQGMGEAAPVGSMTAAGRPEAAFLRDALLKNPLNRINLEGIESCVFAVCLDDAPVTEEGAPDTEAAFGSSLIGGDSANRWFDKSLQIVSEPGGRLGVNLEHSGSDAGIWLYVFGRADEAICVKKLPEGEDHAHVRLLEWNIDTQSAARLQSIREDFARTMHTVTIRQRRIRSVTKERIKAKNCSPDAFVQLLYQAAYYKGRQRFCSIYEAVSTREFYQGRTECVRPVTEASTAFIRALYDGKDSAAELLHKFRLAEKAHADSISRGQKALGPERHMSGLYAMYTMYAGSAPVCGDTSSDLLCAPGQDRKSSASSLKAAPSSPGPKLGHYLGFAEPEIFKDEGYLALRHDTLSTSSATAACIDFFGFGPVVADGLGIGYGLKDDALHMMISSYETSDVTADSFLDAMEEAAERFLQILGGENRHY